MILYSWLQNKLFVARSLRRAGLGRSDHVVYRAIKESSFTAPADALTGIKRGKFHLLLLGTRLTWRPLSHFSYFLSLSSHAELSKKQCDSAATVAPLATTSFCIASSPTSGRTGASSPTSGSAGVESRWRLEGGVNSHF